MRQTDRQTDRHNRPLVSYNVFIQRHIELTFYSIIKKVGAVSQKQDITRPKMIITAQMHLSLAK